MSNSLKSDIIKSKLLVFGLLGIGLAPPILASDTLCSNQETTEFNCSTGKKIISVCASKDLATDKGYLQYRFGRKDAQEIQVPAGQDHAIPPAAKSGTVSVSGGKGAYLRFTNGEFSYVVYSATGKPWGKKSGVVVEEGDKSIAKIKCKGDAHSAIGTKLAEKAGLAADDKSFKLP